MSSQQRSITNLAKYKLLKDPALSRMFHIVFARSQLTTKRPHKTPSSYNITSL